MEHRHARGRVYSSHARGVFPARGVRPLPGALWSIATRRGRNASSPCLGGMSNADLESALSGLGSYFLLNSSHDLVQRVLRAILL
jgi:hypothetical protein